MSYIRLKKILKTIQHAVRQLIVARLVEFGLLDSVPRIPGKDLLI